MRKREKNINSGNLLKRKRGKKILSGNFSKEDDAKIFLYNSSRGSWIEKFFLGIFKGNTKIKIGKIDDPFNLVLSEVGP